MCLALRPIAFLFVALLSIPSLGIAANNPDITIGISTDGPRYIAVSSGTELKATLHWPSNATPISGTFLWYATPNKIGSLSPETTTGSDSSTANLFGYRAGTVNVVVRWIPSQSGYDYAATQKTVTVVELASLRVTGAEKSSYPFLYYAHKANGYATIEAVLNPVVSASVLPSGLLQWFGGEAGDDQLHRKVSTATLGATTVTCILGSSSADAIVKVAELTKLVVSNATRVGSSSTYLAKKAASGDVEVAAEMNPLSPAAELPANFVTWTGGQAGGDQLTRKVTTATAGSTVVTATCGSSSDAATIKVCEIVKLIVTNATRVGTSTTYVAAKAATGDVLIEAQMNPSVSASDLPSDFVIWEPTGLAGDDQLHKKVTKTVAAVTNVKATCGTSSAGAAIKVIELVKLVVTGATQVGTSTTYVTSKSNVGDVLLTADLNPVISASELPSGFVSWTGGVPGDDQLNRKVTKSVAAQVDVIAECGSMTKEAKIIVADVTFSPNPLDNIIVTKSAPLSVTVAPAAIQDQISFDTRSHGVATVSGSAPSLSVKALSSGATQVFAKIGDVEIASVDVSGISNDAFDATNASVLADAPDQNIPNAWGWCWDVNVTADFTAGRNGTKWKPILTGVAGHYDIEATLAGRTEVTGPGSGGNTTAANAAQQIADLDALGGPQWYMIDAVWAHELVHESRILPSLRDDTVLAPLETKIEQLEVSSEGVDQTAAISALRAIPGFSTALTDGHDNWRSIYWSTVPADHAVGCPAAEHGVVDPMVTLIKNAFPSSPTP